MKQKKCKVCKQLFTPFLSTAKVCSRECAESLAVSTRLKAEKVAKVKEKRSDKVKRDKLKSRADWARDAQTAVNKYVRLRDAHLGCVSCDKPASWGGQWHASHFRSVGAATAVRFNLWNIHKSCSVCNNWKSGNLSEYEPKLRKKIGDEKVDWLRSQNGVTKFDADYLIRLKVVFTKKTRRLLAKHCYLM